MAGTKSVSLRGCIRPSGRIISLDQDRLYGFGRDYYPPSPGNRHQMYLAGESERLFAALRTDGSTSMEAKEAKPRRKPAADNERDILWSTPADLQVRGMVLAGEGGESDMFGLPLLAAVRAVQ